MFQLKYVHLNIIHLNIILNPIDPSNIAACGHAGLTRGMHTVALGTDSDHHAHGRHRLRNMWVPSLLNKGVQAPLSSGGEAGPMRALSGRYLSLRRPYTGRLPGSHGHRYAAIIKSAPLSDPMTCTSLIRGDDGVPACRPL